MCSISGGDADGENSVNTAAYPKNQPRFHRGLQ